MGRHTQGRHRRPRAKVVAARMISAGGLLALSAYLLVPEQGTSRPQAAPPVVEEPTTTAAAEPVATDTALPPLALIVPQDVPYTGPTPSVEHGPPADSAPPAQAPKTSKATPKPAPKPVAPKPVAPVAPKPVPVTGGSHGGLIGIARGLIGIGIPYVFGGKSLLGMDCSGFIWEVLKRAGYNVPYRNSAALKAWATPITAAQAQPGDLVFWPGHVAIYVGPGIVIDNGTSAGPKQTKIWGSPTYGRIPL
jgi:peptidoglycan DL-endopeptidase CwlO